MIEKIIEKYYDKDILKADGFDEAIIGVSEDFDQPLKLIYSVSKCLEILEQHDMDEFDAMEYFTYHISGAYVGEKTPIWCWDNF